MRENQQQCLLRTSRIQASEMFATFDIKWYFYNSWPDLLCSLSFASCINSLYASIRLFYILNYDACEYQYAINSKLPKIQSSDNLNSDDLIIVDDEAKP